MSTEISVLALSGLLLVVQFAIMAVPANIQLGSAWTTGPRDEPRQLSGIAGRLKRAMNNHLEGLVFFTVAVVVVTLSDQSSGLTRACAYIYLIARLLYVPAYASGAPMVRSVVWMIGFGATALMILAALF